MSEFQIRLREINSRAIAHLSEHNRLIGAANQAVALILLLATFAIFFEGASYGAEQQHQINLSNQESHHG